VTFDEGKLSAWFSGLRYKTFRHVCVTPQVFAMGCDGSSQQRGLGPASVLEGLQQMPFPSPRVRNWEWGRGL
jgi:hypothetical protein